MSTAKPRMSFREAMRRHDLAELDGMSDEQKLTLIEDARAYRRLTTDIREYNALRIAAREKDIPARLVQSPELPGVAGDDFAEFAAHHYADGFDDGHAYAERMARRTA